jgi:protoporphyrinogen oxidase
MDFVVIGGDAAGMSAASRAKRNMPQLNVTVFEMSLDVSYSA